MSGPPPGVDVSRTAGRLRMTTCRAVLALSLLGWTSISAAQNANPPAAEAWSLRPSVYAFGSIDQGTATRFAVNGDEDGEASPAANLGASLDLQRNAGDGRFHGMLFGLVRTPVSGQDRSFFVSGRVQGSHPLSPDWTLTFDDRAKVQRRPRLRIVDFQRNEAAVGLSWRNTAGRGVSLEVADRRRAVPEIQALGFSRQSASFTVSFPLMARGAADVGASVQHFDAPTAAGD